MSFINLHEVSNEKKQYYNLTFTDFTKDFPYYQGYVFNLADAYILVSQKTQVTYWYASELVFTSSAHHRSFATALCSASLQPEHVSAPGIESIHHKEPLGGTGV